jgi:hypothetical protein
VRLEPYAYFHVTARFEHRVKCWARRCPNMLAPRCKQSGTITLTYRLRRPERGYSGEGTAGSFSPRIRRRRAVSLPPIALTCSVAFASPKTGMLE